MYVCHRSGGFGEGGEEKMGEEGLFIDDKTAESDRHESRK